MRVIEQTTVNTFYEFIPSEIIEMIIEISKELNSDISIDEEDDFGFSEQLNKNFIEIHVTYNKLSGQEDYEDEDFPESYFLNEIRIAKIDHENLIKILEDKLTLMCKESNIKIQSDYTFSDCYDSKLNFRITDYNKRIIVI